MLSYMLAGIRASGCLCCLAATRIESAVVLGVGVLGSFVIPPALHLPSSPVVPVAEVSGEEGLGASGFDTEVHRKLPPSLDANGLGRDRLPCYLKSKTKPV